MSRLHGTPFSRPHATSSFDGERVALGTRFVTPRAFLVRLEPVSEVVLTLSYLVAVSLLKVCLSVPISGYFRNFSGSQLPYDDVLTYLTLSSLLATVRLLAATYVNFVFWGRVVIWL